MSEEHLHSEAHASKQSFHLNIVEIRNAGSLKLRQHHHLHWTCRLCLWTVNKGNLRQDRLGDVSEVVIDFPVHPQVSHDFFKRVLEEL